MGGAANEQEAAAPAPTAVVPMLQPEGEMLEESMMPATKFPHSSFPEGWGLVRALFLSTGCVQMAGRAYLLSLGVPS